MAFDYELRDFRGVCRLFPLPRVVLLPHAVLPLHIFEPRYRQMTEDALATDKLVTMVQFREPVDWAAPGPPAIEEVACLGRILNHERLPDGRFNFLLLGVKRVRLLREVPGPTLYRQAEAVLIDDEEPEASEAAPRRAELVRLFRAAATAARALDPDLADLLGQDLPLGTLTDIVAHALGLPPALKQAFLDDRHALRRAEGLLSLLRQAVGRAPDAPQAGEFPPPFSAN